VVPSDPEVVLGLETTPMFEVEQGGVGCIQAGKRLGMLTRSKVLPPADAVSLDPLTIGV